MPRTRSSCIAQPPLSISAYASNKVKASLEWSDVDDSQLLRLIRRSPNDSLARLALKMRRRPGVVRGALRRMVREGKMPESVRKQIRRAKPPPPPVAQVVASPAATSLPVISEAYHPGSFALDRSGTSDHRLERSTSTSPSDSLSKSIVPPTDLRTSVPDGNALHGSQHTHLSASISSSASEYRLASSTASRIGKPVIPVSKRVADLLSFSACSRSSTEQPEHCADSHAPVPAPAIALEVPCAPAVSSQSECELARNAPLFELAPLPPLPLVWAPIALLPTRPAERSPSSSRRAAKAAHIASLRRAAAVRLATAAAAADSGATQILSQRIYPSGAAAFRAAHAWIFGAAELAVHVRSELRLQEVEAQHRRWAAEV